mgnify:FL=1
MRLKWCLAVFMSKLWPVKLVWGLRPGFVCLGWDDYKYLLKACSFRTTLTFRFPLRCFLTYALPMGVIIFVNQIKRYYFPFWKFGCLKVLLKLLCLVLWNPYILSCLTKLFILLCLKYLGSTIYSSFAMSFIVNSVPLDDQ